MSTADDIPEPDRIEGARHPRETAQLFGQDTAVASFLEAFNSKRMHHGWLLTGPKGVGKATLAWQIARFLLATPNDTGGGLFGDAPQFADNLDISPDHPVSRRLLAGSEPGLCVIRRPYDDKTKKLKSQITVDEVRKLKGFFSLSSADGGRRVVIVDSADELNVSAANALLKLLEEPPADAVLMLISHQPSKLLPTIRSRCRELRLAPLSQDAMTQALQQAEAEVSATAALGELAAGSVGEAITFAQKDGLSLYTDIVRLFSSLPDLDRQAALKLAESAVGRGVEGRFDLLLNLIDLFLARLARNGAGFTSPVEVAQGETDLFARLCPTPHKARDWADVAQEISTRSRHGQAVNLDPASLVLDTVWRIQQTAAK